MASRPSPSMMTDAVGQHAVDIEQQQPDAGARGPRASSSGERHGSDHLRAPEVVQVHDAFDASLGVDHDERRDLALFHEPQRLDGEHRAADRHRLARS